MLKNYELLYIIHPDLEGSSEKVTEKVAGFIKKDGGEIKSQEDWGKRKLAYKIAKNDFGVYVLVYFVTDSANLPKIERDLRLSEEIMRSMITILPEIKKIRKPRKPKTDEKVAEKSAPKVETKAKTEASDETIEEKTETIAKETKAKAALKTEAKEKKPTKAQLAKEEAAKAKDETERLKKLDEKLGELLGE